ncbi:Bug family tripartite tricarboxylate transporter substrate binding protein [Noviherbaspirillum aerium]|uniref:Bug family tripartite tricarboxylate transporter substrate binding protein n=1 Tax=Noviherbaspirillum aerium TaxID=2588497 RepID=UPI00124E810B|nr:tripartite tricarboxylate transporter substrate binding protein [Noviherbaspirillum aerium]
MLAHSIQRLKGLKRSWLAAGAVMLAATAAPDLTSAQSGKPAHAWPTETVKLIVPTAPGSSGDIVARLLANKLSPIWGHPVVIENRPGAGGLIAMRATASAAPDGHTLTLTHTSAAVVTPYVYRAAKYDVEKDFTPIAVIGYTPMAIVASVQSREKDLAELIEASRQNPDKLAMGHPGHATMAHLSAELLGQEAGAKIFLANMGSAANGLKGVLAGDIQYYIDGLAPLMPMIRSNRVRLLTVFSDKVPDGLEGTTLAKSSTAGMVMHGWFAMMGPAGMPKAVTGKINADVNQVLALPEITARLKDFATYPQTGSVDEATSYIQAEKQRWSKVLKRANIEAQ